MGKTLKRQRQRALREQQQQQQDGGCKLPRIAGMPVLKPSSSCSKYTYVVSAALRTGNWLAALQTLDAMIKNNKVPKLGAIQRWVRDADQSGDEAVTARLIDAICRSTLPADARHRTAAAPAVTDTAAGLLKGSVKRHPAWRPHPAQTAADIAATDSSTAESQITASNTVEQAADARSQQQQHHADTQPARVSNPGTPDQPQQKHQQLSDYQKQYYQVPFAPGNGGPDAIYAYPAGTIKFDKHHPPVTAVPVPFVPGAQCLVGVLSKRECEQIMKAAEAIGYNSNVDYTFGGANGGDGAAEQQQQQQDTAAADDDDDAEHEHQLSSGTAQLQEQQQPTSDKPSSKKLYSTLNPGGLDTDPTAEAAAEAATGNNSSKSAARGVAADLVGMSQGGPAAGCVWLADESLLGPVYDRVAHLLPQELGGGKLAGINARWRLYRYTPGNVYRPHIDGAWPGSGLDQDGKYLFDAHGDRWSRLTFLVYLNDDFEGGHTTYYTPNEEQVGVLDARGVQPVQGNVMVFPHGGTVGSLVHEGSAVLKGAKYVVRTDVLYMKVESNGRRGQQPRA